MTLLINGSNLKIEDIVNVARNNEKVGLDPNAVEKINKCREMLERKIIAREIMYGVNTGIGEFSEVVLNDDQVQDFQKYLVYNHAAGIGDPMPLEYVRAAMLSRINVHSHGNSGNRIEITQTLVDMLNKGVTPFVCQKGSVGASGDLAPMSQIALLMMGEGKAYYKEELMTGKEAMDKGLITEKDIEEAIYGNFRVSENCSQRTLCDGLMVGDCQRPFYGVSQVNMTAFLRDKNKVILFFGTIRKYKGLDILIRAFAKVSKNNTSRYFLC